MERIGVIAPDSIVYENMLALVSQMDLNDRVSVYNATLDAALSVAKDMEEQGTHVIITRGSTLELLKNKGIATPFVNISFSIYDLSTIITRAREITGVEKPRIGVITYSRIDPDVAAFAHLLDMDMRVYHGEASRHSIFAAVAQAVDDSMDVVVGGVTTQEALKGSKAMFLSYVSGKTSLKRALFEALRIAKARNHEQHRARNFKAAVNAIKDGVITLDNERRIVMINDAAQRFLDLETSAAYPLLESLWPELQEPLKAPRDCVDELFPYKGRWFFVNTVALSHKGDIHSYVITFQQAERIEQAETRLRKQLASSGFAARHTFSSIKGASPSLRAVIQQCECYAKNSSPVLLFGESGTGKELFAQAIHNAGPRKDEPFVAVNCSALPPSLLESELFGYDEGAFTGAGRKGKSGLFELAHKGTIFLDEISAMDIYGQTRLLRVLQEGHVFRLGGVRYTPVDFRVIAATNRDLWSMVERGLFREDLFFRLNVLPVFLPPLRERPGDVKELAERFSLMYGKTPAIFSQDALEELAAGQWPGNVRELQNCIQRLCLGHNREIIRAKDVRKAMSTPRLSGVTRAMPFSEPTCVFEKQLPPEREEGRCPSASGACPAASACERDKILAALREAHGNQLHAAAILGMHKSTLYRKIRRYDIRKLPV